MSNLTTSSDFSKLQTWEDLRRWVTQFAEDTKVQINGNLDFTSNLRCNILDVNFTAANSTVQIKHKLLKTPIGYILTKTNVATSLYDGVGTWDQDFLYLKSTAIADCKVLVF